MDNKIHEKILECYFMVVAILMYYFLNESLSIGIHITYRHIFALVLSSVILKEQMSLFGVIGAVMILGAAYACGTFVVEYVRERRKGA